MSDQLDLAQGFDEVSREDWEAAVDDATKGRGVASLTRTLPEGFEVAPLVTPQDGIAATGIARGTHEPWGVRVVARHPDVEVANRTLLDELERGASEVHVRLDLATRSGTGEGRGVDGVAVADAAQLGALLDGVLLDLAPVSLDAGASFHAAGTSLLDLADGTAVAGLRLGADPLAALASTGTLPQGMENALAQLVDLARRSVEVGGARAVAVDTSTHHDAGATEELDLGIALGTAVVYLRAMVEAGLDVADAADQIEFRIPVGVDQFLGIAKLRALRLLWRRVLEASGVSDPAPALVHAELGASLLSRRDPWTNLLRGTIATFAAAVGGADSVTVPPFDARLGLPTELGRRVARNTQHVLRREGHLARVADPAAGSHHVEALTHDLAHAAWATFQRIEHEGGMVAALVDGHVHDGIARRLADRERAVATRKRPVTGVSQFPLLDERLPAVDDPDAAIPTGLPASGFLPAEGPHLDVPALVPAPVAAPFEDLRDAAQARPVEPTILSVNLGPLARHTARATFAANLFAAGGIRAIPTDGFDEPGAAVAALGEAGINLAVVCGDDEQYADVGAAFVSALRDAGATVWLAGRPDEAIPADGFVHLGCDVVAVLDHAHGALG